MALTRITKGVIKPNENYDTHNINSTGIITATKFVGPVTGAITGTAALASGLTGTPSITVQDVIAVGATFSGNVSIAGTLTYEDVTNIDAVGLITARSGIKVTGGVTELIKGTSGGATANTDAALIVDNSSHTYVQFRTPDNKEQGLLFGDDADNDAGAITYSHSSNHLGFRVNADERVRIDNQGRVGINTDSFLSGEMLSIRGGANDSSEFNFHTYADFKGGTDAWEGYTAIFRGATAANSNNQWTGIGAKTSYGWIDFANNSSSRIVMKSTGVGIGTNNPNNPLTVHASGNHIYLKDTATDNNLQIRHASGVAEFNTFGTGGARRDYVFNQYATEVLRIDSSSRLIVGGGTDPTQTTITAKGNSTSATGFSVIDLRRGEAADAVDDVLGYIRFSDTNITSSNENYAHIHAAVDAASTNASDNPGRLVFSTTADGDPGPTERFRINSTGQLELRKNQDGVTGRPANRIVFKDLDSSVAANQPIGEISWYSTDAGMTNINSYIRGINEATNGSGALTFGVKAAGSSEIEAMRIKSSGRVGINTDNPGTNLTVWANDGVTNTDVFQVRSKSGAFNIQVSDSDAANPEWALRTYANEPIVFKQATVERLRIESSGAMRLKSEYLRFQAGDHQVSDFSQKVGLKWTYETDIEIAKIEVSRPSWSGGPSDILFHTCNTSGTVAEKLRITNDGKVGINDDNPGAQLVVRATTDDNPALQLYRHSTGGDIASLIWQTNSGTQAKINYRGAAGANEGMQFYTAGGSSSQMRMIIDHSGNVGINDTDPNAKLVVAQDGLADNTYSFAASYRSGNNASGYTASGISISGTADNSNGEKHTSYINFSSRDPALNGSHGASSWITMTNPDSQSTYGTGQLDFYIRHGSKYSFPNDPQATSGYWMDSLFTIKSSGQIGIGSTAPDRDLEVCNSGGQTAIGIRGGSNTAQCSLWFMKPTDGNIGGIYYLHGSDDNQGFHFRANDQQVANIKGSGILQVTNTISGAGHTAGVHIFKSSGSNDDHAELAVGYDRQNCYVIKRKRNSGAIEINTTQSGGRVQHEYMGATRWMEHSEGMINTYAAGGANFIGRWRYCQTNQSQNYEHKILGPDGSTLKAYTDNNVHGIIWVAVVGTGTGNAYTQYRFSNRSAEDSLQLYHIAGGSSAGSNIPWIVNDGNNCPAWKMDHSGTYTMIIDVMVTGGKSTNGTYSVDAIRGANP